MKKILKYLSSPYPLFCQRWKVALISCGIVFFILLLFQPFGISAISHNKLGILLGYMAVTGLFLCIPVYLLPLLFPDFYEDERWTVGKHLLNNLFIFFFIAVGLWLYSDWIFGWGLRWDIFCSFLVSAVVVGIFPTAFFVMLNRNRFLASHLREAMEMNQYLQKAESIPNRNRLEDEKEYIVFSGGTKESFELIASDLLYVEAEGNYVKIVYRKNEKCTHKMLRATMKQVEEVSRPFSYIVKSHRAFLVNLCAVSKVSGNSQGYRLFLYDCEDSIPVSRAYSKEVKMLIEKMNSR
ncbi:LytR/AlgR family response regulator transcription factor [Bacteroides salyersiae]|uniref:LytR/AlgR family response regulator transcription factor n=1 Tax=Bacteroides salyersiae TaxID=291644 RepID=UPI001C8B2EC1|nr:LytTR family DNA-binding domain-containing protein [Bacteroides salyersiae]